MLVVPKTQSIKYAGSKLKLLSHIRDIVDVYKPKTVLDAFSGSTRVSQMLAKSGYRVIANDVSVWSKILGQCYLLSNKPVSYYKEIVEHLNSLDGIDGYYSERYGGNSIGKRPFQLKNTKRLDAIMSELKTMRLDDISRSVILTSLMLALDKVDNTLGHYSSYLKEWSSRSYQDMKLEVPQIIINLCTNEHEVHQTNILESAQTFVCDLAYLDPPYGSNNEKMPPSRVRYAAYYHIWTSICLDDRPDVFGKVNRRIDSSDKIAYSPFEDFRKNQDGKFIAVNAIKSLLYDIQAKYILLSYSSGGRATKEELMDAINSCGKLLDFKSIDYKRNVMGQMKWTNEWVKDVETPNIEYLIIMEKN